MVRVFGPWVPAFLLAVAMLLTAFSYGSWRLRQWAWPLTLAAYSVGVLGSLWEVSTGIAEAWLGVVINGAVVVYASTRSVRASYGWNQGQG